MNLNEVLGQYCDDEIDVPTIDSKYLDLDDLKSLENENVNFQNCAYSYMHVNIRSLPDKINKLQLMLSELNENDIRFDFILICETFLSETNNNMFNISGYTFVGKNRRGKVWRSRDIYT